MKINEYKSFPLYMTTSAISVLVITLLVGFGMYIIWPGLVRIHYALALSSEIALGVGLLQLWILFLSLALAIWGKVNFHPLIMRISNRCIYGLFPLSLLWARIGGFHKDQLRQSMIDLINKLVVCHMYTVPAHRILLLTPHCLQQSTCVHKVTYDVHNCKQCGCCNVGDLLAIAKEFGCQFLVVTGGTLARLKVKEAKPKAIVAIACERDLSSGMADVYPIPVIGVLNERPNGPCCNTKVDPQLVRQSVLMLIGKDEHGSTK